jgi:hypothetical protein
MCERTNRPDIWTQAICQSTAQHLARRGSSTYGKSSRRSMSSRRLNFSPEKFDHGSESDRAGSASLTGWELSRFRSAQQVPHSLMGSWPLTDQAEYPMRLFRFHAPNLLVAIAHSRFPDVPSTLARPQCPRRCGISLLDMHDPSRTPVSPPLHPSGRRSDWQGVGGGPARLRWVFAGIVLLMTHPHLAPGTIADMDRDEGRQAGNIGGC